jgi:hypothetical protein
MLVVLDTIRVLQTSTQKDSTGKYQKRWVTERKCGKIIKDSLKGKVALLYMSKGCDVSTQVLNAQNAGAIVAIVIHTTDNRDSVELPKQSSTVRYVDDSKVRIPCFTVRKGIGAKLTTMLPSVVGIQRPKTNVNNPASSVVVNNPNTLATQQSQRDSLPVAEQGQNGFLLDDKATTSDFPLNNRIGWAVSPNPASDEVVLHYNFDKMGDVHIEIFNEIGQVVKSVELPKVQTGKLTLDVTRWQTGLYNVSLRSGSLKEVKRLVIAR